MCLFEKVKDLCDQKGVSLYQMCKETGINQNTVSNWKARRSKMPNLESAIALANYFGVSADYFCQKG